MVCGFSVVLLDVGMVGLDRAGCGILVCCFGVWRLWALVWLRCGFGFKLVLYLNACTCMVWLCGLVVFGICDLWVCLCLGFVVLRCWLIVTCACGWSGV